MPSLQGAAILARARAGETSRLILRTIWLCHYPRILAALVLQLFYSGIQFAGPLLLNQIVKFISLPTAEEAAVRARLPACLPTSGPACLPACLAAG
jgi:hypothetical protein